MIEKTSSYKTSDGAVHATIEAAQEAELAILLTKESDDAAVVHNRVIKFLVEHSAEVLAILGTKARKPRTPKVKPAAVKPPKGSPAKTS